ncbi:hypothetical protein ACJX0J_019397, partial [Zea mays]
MAIAYHNLFFFLIYMICLSLGLADCNLFVAAYLEAFNISLFKLNCIAQNGPKRVLNAALGVAGAESASLIFMYFWLCSLFLTTTFNAVNAKEEHYLPNC